VRVAPGTLDVAARERDLLWEASVRRDQELKRRAMDADRYHWHTGQAQRLRETMTKLITQHETQARKILEARKLTEGSGA
jgi:hypothetical protein